MTAPTLRPLAHGGAEVAFPDGGDPAGWSRRDLSADEARALCGALLDAGFGPDVPPLDAERRRAVYDEAHDAALPADEGIDHEAADAKAHDEGLKALAEEAHWRAYTHLWQRIDGLRREAAELRAERDAFEATTRAVAADCGVDPKAPRAGVRALRERAARWKALAKRLLPHKRWSARWNAGMIRFRDLECRQRDRAEAAEGFARTWKRLARHLRAEVAELDGKAARALAHLGDVGTDREGRPVPLVEAAMIARGCHDHERARADRAEAFAHRWKALAGRMFPWWRLKAAAEYGLEAYADMARRRLPRLEAAEAERDALSRALAALGLRACDAHAAVYRAMRSTPGEAFAACQDGGYLHEAVHACLPAQALPDGVPALAARLDDEVRRHVEALGERALRAEQERDEAVARAATADAIAAGQVEVNLQLEAEAGRLREENERLKRGAADAVEAIRFVGGVADRERARAEKAEVQRDPKAIDLERAECGAALWRSEAGRLRAAVREAVEDMTGCVDGPHGGDFGQTVERCLRLLREALEGPDPARGASPLALVAAEMARQEATWGDTERAPGFDWAWCLGGIHAKAATGSGRELVKLAAYALRLAGKSKEGGGA